MKKLLEVNVVEDGKRSLCMAELCQKLRVSDSWVHLRIRSRNFPTHELLGIGGVGLRFETLNQWFDEVTK